MFFYSPTTVNLS